MIDCSIITIVNNIDQYNQFEKNIETQENVSYELIPVMNIDNKMYDSARQALKDGANKAKGKYLFFTHTDIRFLDNMSLCNIYNYVEKIKNFGIIGIAGCPEALHNGRRVILSNIVHGINKENAGIKISSEEKVQTVDECLFVESKETFDKIGFTNKKGWHLYAVEQCLRCEQEGYYNFVIPAHVWHISDGKSLDPNYVLQIIKLRKEYKEKYKYINTTVKMWKTSGLWSNMYVFYYYVKQCIKKKVYVGLLKRS